VQDVLAHRLLRRGHVSTVKRMAAIGIFMTLAPFFLWPFTWYWVGSYADYHAAPRQSAVMFQNATFFVSWAVAVGYLVLTSIGFGVWLKASVRTLTQEGTP
jgi:hypothetical protein